MSTRLGGGRRAQRDRHRAGHPAGVVQHQVGDVGLPARRRAPRSPGRALAHSSEITCGARSHSAPLSRRHGRVERTGVQPRGAEPDRRPAGPRALPADLGEPGPDLGVEPRGEEHHRRHPGRRDRLRPACRPRPATWRSASPAADASRSARPAPRSRPARPAAPRTRHRPRLARNSSRSRRGGDPVARGQRGRGLVVAAPDGGELDPLGAGERRGVRDLGPVAGADQAELHLLDHLSILAAG